MSATNKQIEIKGAKVHNLKNIDITIDRNKLIVVTGLSGSGKSSFAFDTLYAEGQRRYVESLSSYARQFLGKIHKPEVDYIKGIPPAIAIEQKVNTRNPRSTVGTSTEIYDYIKLLYARVGKTISPVSGQEVSCSSVSDVVDYAMSLPEGERLLILAPIKEDSGRSFIEDLEVYMKQGFSRIYSEGELLNIDEILNQNKLPERNSSKLVIDRMVLNKNTETENQLADSIQIAFFEGQGDCFILIKPIQGKEHLHSFSNRFEADGIKFEQPSVHMLCLNNP